MSVEAAIKMIVSLGVVTPAGAAKPGGAPLAHPQAGP
jgi:uncharacterized membrane protein